MPSREFTASEEAVRQGREIGIGGDVKKRLERMAKRSAPLTHADGNRRFDEFVLDVREDGTVAGVNRL